MRNLFLIFLLLPLFSCAGSSFGLPKKSFTAQIDENFILYLSANSKRNLILAERHTLDFAAADEITQWRDENGIIQGTLTASQIFKVGELNCRRLSHVRLDNKSLQATICRAKTQENWHIIK